MSHVDVVLAQKLWYLTQNTVCGITASPRRAQLLINAHKKPFKRLHPSRLTTLSANNGSLLQLWPHLGSLSQVSSSPWESIIHIHCSRHMQSNVRHAIIALLMTPGITHFVFKTINLLESVKIQLSKSLYYKLSEIGFRRQIEFIRHNINGNWFSVGSVMISWSK